MKASIIRRVKLDRQGYTSSGKYYGVGAPVYECEYSHDGEEYVSEIRAADHKVARQIINNNISVWAFWSKWGRTFVARQVA
jgi:hypothetical protein